MPDAATTDPAITFELHGDRELVMTRAFDAPRELVWEACTRPEHMARWWGPRRFTNTVHQMDVRPGGAWRIEQHAPDGRSYVFWGEYLEVAPPEKLVHTQRFLEFAPLVVTLTLETRDGGTLLTSRTAFPTPQDREGALAMGMKAGAVESLERLGELVAALRS